MAIKHRKIVLGAFAAIMSLGVFTALNRPVHAEIISTGNPIHMQITPSKQKLKLEPGRSQVSSIKVMNIGEKKFTYTVSAAPYTVIDENYNADYENNTNDYTKMYNWVTIDEKLKTGTLEKGESVDVPFTVTVPSDAPSGGQYAAIMAETADSSDPNSAIKTVNRLGMILYADITGGQVKINGKIVNNTINSFLFEPPISASALIESNSNVETTATCTLKIWPFGSSETVYNNEENPVKLDIIPKTRRFNTITWDNSPRLGIFTVEQKIEYLDEPASITRKTVIICPLWLAILFFAIAAALIIWLIFRIVKRHKAKNGTQDNNQEERRI
ncbi:DUF916 domain-containing protein [Candidatus Saccharibacteria bacterium]|nr:DUF916 domain-containing protein [Candidatus Saccharibacteria bacterium]